ncbi:MAG: AAA family ATPase, partial [Desulfobaccales bacterium]
MYISGFHIDGFGIYHDQGVQDLPRGLVLFVGHNESGKTTLMEFLRVLLFGFPRRDKRRNDYEPWRGGNHGGRLQVIMQDGRRFTIARPGRQPATLTQDSGAPLPGEPAVHLLGGLDRETFNHVFAVGLEELQGLGVLSQEGVRGRLFAAGAGLGSASVPELMKGLDKELANLLAQRGQKQIINLLTRQVKEIEARIRELQGQAAAYAEGQQQRERLEARVEAQRREVEGRRRELGRLDRLEQARLPWVNRNLAREQAAEVEFARDFPVNGLERLESLDKELNGVRQAHQEKDEAVIRLQEQLTPLTVDEAVLARQEDIEALGSEREKLAAAQDDYPQVKSALDQAQAEFLRKLRELGPSWDASRLAQVDTSVQVRQWVAEFGRRLEAAERQGEGARAQERAMAEAAAEAHTRDEAAAQQLLDFPPLPIREVQVLHQQQEALRRLRAWFHQREVLAEKLRARVSARDETDARAEALARQLAAPAATLPWWLGLPWLVIGLGLGGWFLHQRAYLPGGLIPGVGLVLAALFLFLARRQAAAEARRRNALQQELEQVEGNRDTLSEAVTALEGEITAAADQIFQAARIMGREPPADAMALEDLAGDLEQAAARLRDWQGKDQEKRQADDHLAQARVRLEQARAATAQASLDLEGLQDEWAGWLTNRGFSDPVRPAGFEAVLQAVENARAAGAVLDDQRRRLGMLSDYLASAQARIGQVLAACGRTPHGPEPGLE